MNRENTDWSRSAAGVVIKDGKVLLCRHSYGAGSGLLIVPGGYLERGESPQDAVCREVLEETGVTVKPGRLIGARFSQRDWYMAFAAGYVCGEARSDGEENSEVVWMDCEEALEREDVPKLTKALIQSALWGGGLFEMSYEGKNPGTLYGAPRPEDERSILYAIE